MPEPIKVSLQITRNMESDMTFLADLAQLATTSALVHYAFGFSAMVASLVAFCLIEHGVRIWTELCNFLHHLWASIALNHRRTHPLGGPTQKTLHRRSTRRQSGSPHSNTWSDHDGNSGDLDESANARQQLETFNTNTNTNDYDANTNNSAMETARQELFAKLTIRDLTSCAPSPPRSEPSSTSSAATTVSATSRNESPRFFQDTTSQSQRQWPLVQLNAREPIPFENDLFVGHVLFLVRTTPEDPHWAHLFVGKRRMFWIQVQGRFKRKPHGVVYLGGELPSRISLGIFTKSIALVIMGIIQQLVGKVYMSFGGRRAAAAAAAGSGLTTTELPAVSFPLYQSVDQFMATPAGETPPPLGREDFGESDHARGRRRQAPLGSEPFDVGPTYSFHFHTMYVDLTRWQTANLPGLSDMDLTTFFDSLPLHIVAYDTPSPPNGKHLQQDKQYLFNFEVSYNKRALASAAEASLARNRRLWRSDSEQSFASSESTTTTAMSGSRDVSPCPTVTRAEEQAAVADALATIDRENARALRCVSLEYLYWIEEVDAEMNQRRVQYVYRMREESDVHAATSRVVVVTAYKLRLLLGGKFRPLNRLYTLQSLRFHTISRIGAYSIINDEALEVTTCLQRLIELARQENAGGSDLAPAVAIPVPADDAAKVAAFESALYQLLTARTHLQLPHDGTSLTTELTPAKVGVSLSKRDRDDLHVAFEGVVYRFYAETLVRQEVMVLTSTILQFYRSYSSSVDKIVPMQRVIGVQSATVPFAVLTNDGDSDGTGNGGGNFAFAFQINTFAEEILVCVPTEHARNTWIRVILQQCCLAANFDRSLLTEALIVCATPSKSLKPANRVLLNSRSLFPRRHCLVAAEAVSSADGSVDDNQAVVHQDALQMVQFALRSALAIHELGEKANVMAILAFLNHASALRSVDLPSLMERPHEDRLAFFLNLYHVVLAHAMIAHGFPRSKGQWDFFQTHMCYVVGKDPQYMTQPLSMSLAEIEHVILRARLPQATALPHLSMDKMPPRYALRLAPFGLAHPDFRVSFALLMNQSDEEYKVPIFESATIHEQLNGIVQRYVTRDVAIDVNRKTITLPRICEWFKHDFGGGGSPMYCVRKLLGFMDEATQERALRVLDSPVLVHIGYGAFKYSPRATLTVAPAGP